MKNEKNETENKKMGQKSTNYIYELRRNIDALMDEHDLTIKELADKSDMPFETLKNFLYDREAKDCRLSTVIKLAKALDMGLDELVGIGTYSDDTLEFIGMYRKLPSSSRSLIKWHIKDQAFSHAKYKAQRIISVMTPICANGNLKKTTDYEQIDIGEIGEELLHKIFMGIRIPCDHYLPHYIKDDILLLANDRDAIKGENTVISINGNLVITKRIVENGIVNYYGIRDGFFRTSNPNHVQVIGYIAKVIS